MQKKELQLIFISLVISLLITASKFYAYFSTRSVAILSDALESIINVIAGSFACYSVYLSSRPRDINHPYGHGKVEFFSIGFEGAMIFIAGCLILFKSFQYFITPHSLTRLNIGTYIMAATAVANFITGSLLKYKGRKSNSVTLTGDGQHLLTDAFSSGGLVVGLLLIQVTGQRWIDPAISLVLGVFILYNGYRLLRRSVSGLMDETDMKVVDNIIDILNKNRRDTWIDVHNMRVQQYGKNYHIDCHVTLPYYFNLNQVHEETIAVEEAINREFKLGEMEFSIHTDPCLPVSCKNCLLAQCPVRFEVFKKKVVWKRENVLPNKKHGEEEE